MPAKCSIDMLSYKAYLTRWMAAATKVAPFIYDQVKAVLESSAKAAALQCSGGANGRMCGLSWSKGASWDGTSGVGQQMAAMEVVQSNLIQAARDPLSAATGGTSVGNPNAGNGDIGSNDPNLSKPSTTADKAGAGILTAVVAAIVLSGIAYISMPDKVVR